VLHLSFPDVRRGTLKFSPAKPNAATARPEMLFRRDETGEDLSTERRSAHESASQSTVVPEAADATPPATCGDARVQSAKADFPPSQPPVSTGGRISAGE